METPKQADSAYELMQILEARETWVFGSYDGGLQRRAQDLKEKIVTDIHAAKSVPVETWLLFVAHLPYTQSLEALSDLSLVLPKILERMARVETRDERTVKAKDILLERMNLLLRQKLHNEILTKQRRKAIDTVLRAFQG